MARRCLTVIGHAQYRNDHLGHSKPLAKIQRLDALAGLLLVRVGRDLVQVGVQEQRDPRRGRVPAAAVGDLLLAGEAVVKRQELAVKPRLPLGRAPVRIVPVKIDGLTTQGGMGSPALVAPFAMASARSNWRCG